MSIQNLKVFGDLKFKIFQLLTLYNYLIWCDTIMLKWKQSSVQIFEYVFNSVIWNDYVKIIKIEKSQFIKKLNYWHQETLTEWEGSVRLTSLFNWIGLAHFNNETIICLSYKTSYPNEEVNCTKPPPLVGDPCLVILQGSLT